MATTTATRSPSSGSSTPSAGSGPRRRGTSPAASSTTSTASSPAPPSPSPRPGPGSSEDAAAPERLAVPQQPRRRQRHLPQPLPRRLGRREPPPVSFSTAPALWLFYFTGTVLFAILLQEIGIRWLPVMTSCYCPNIVSRNGLCPCLKSDEKLTPDVRTRMRTWYLVLLAISYTAASTLLTLKGLALVQFLKGLDSKIGGMNPQLGTTYIKMSAFTLIAILLSVLCLRVRQYLEQNKSWMEQQGVDATTLTEPGVKPTDEEATQDLLI
uniref:Uncharacterized protein n=1 Tax=Bionectria ochroleuca TaxID=29856 RepID=A0A8H7NEQ0_BIOOC